MQSAGTDNPELLCAHYQVVLTREGARTRSRWGWKFARRPIPQRTGRSRPRCMQGGSHRGDGESYVVDANSIERSLGKTKRIVDNRPKG